jgi:hypothetical protein
VLPTCRPARPVTTIELKSNHVGTARDGTIGAWRQPCLGRTTQVWDAIVSHRDTGKTIAMFRCADGALRQGRHASVGASNSTTRRAARCGPCASRGRHELALNG